ncbi:MAG: hypothetical protein RQ745_05755 [Longimicrobiales bacterium]|nr:hypothetical protein [Longimicrobiales bacterium]
MTDHPSPSPDAPESPLTDEAPCPFCDGGETERVNAFGAHASVSSWWCRDCRSPFEVLKWRSAPPGHSPPSTQA